MHPTCNQRYQPKIACLDLNRPILPISSYAVWHRWPSFIWCEGCFLVAAPEVMEKKQISQAHSEGNTYVWAIVIKPQIEQVKEGVHRCLELWIPHIALCCRCVPCTKLGVWLCNHGTGKPMSSCYVDPQDSSERWVLLWTMIQVTKDDVPWCALSLSFSMVAP